jgi:hypothetical protein
MTGITTASIANDNIRILRQRSVILPFPRLPTARPQWL